MESMESKSEHSTRTNKFKICNVQVKSGNRNFLNGKTGNWEINIWNFNVESGIIDFWILESEKWNLVSENCERKLKSEIENLEI